MNNTRYHRFRIERDALTQEQYGSIVVGVPIGIGDFDKGSISTTEESTVRRCLSIPDGVPFTMLQHPIDPDRRGYEGKAAAFSPPDGTLVLGKKPNEAFTPQYELPCTPTHCPPFRSKDGGYGRRSAHYRSPHHVQRPALHQAYPPSPHPPPRRSPHHSHRPHHGHRPLHHVRTLRWARAP